MDFISNEFPIKPFLIFTILVKFIHSISKKDKFDCFSFTTANN